MNDISENIPIELQSTVAAERDHGNEIRDIWQDETSVQHDTQSLAPADGGKVAWRLLFTMFIFEALLWGFPLSFGVFQNYYSQLPEFQGSPYISAIGTTASGISYVAAPVMIPLIKRFTRYRRRMIWVGWPLCLLGLVSGSFARTIPSLILTQGVLYGVGFILFYYPILSMVNEFWIAKRGMAYGLLCSASGASGAAMPFLVTALLNKYGYPTTLRIIAVGLFVTTGPLVPLLKGRLPESDMSDAGRTDWSFLRAPLFWIYSVSNLAMGLGYFLPSLYLPSYASQIGQGATRGAVLLAVMSISQVLGQLTFGYLSDHKLPLNLLVISSTLTASIATFLCWGLARSLDLLIVFALVYGFFGAGYTAMWARMGTAISSEPTAAFASYGLLNLGKGVGNILAGPVSGILVMGSVNLERYGIQRYQTMVLVTGSCMFISAAIIPLCYWKRLVA